MWEGGIVNATIVFEIRYNLAFRFAQHDFPLSTQLFLIRGIIKCMKQKVLKYDVVFEEQPDGGYTAIVLSLPGCISEGDTFEETKTNIADAIELYLEDMEADGEEIPISNGSVFVGQVEVNRNKPLSV